MLKGVLGQIFTKSQNKIQDPAKLYKVIDMVNKENWSMFGADLKGKIYEGCWRKMQRILKVVRGNILLRGHLFGQW